MTDYEKTLEKIQSISKRVKASASPGAVVGVTIMLVAVLLASIWNISQTAETVVEEFADTTVQATEVNEEAEAETNDKVGKEVENKRLEKITIYITGSVKNPGIYTLETIARVNDAAIAAGGLTSEADQNVINLATHLKDGDHIHIPSKKPGVGNTQNYQISNGNSATNGEKTETNDSTTQTCVNISSASETELTQLTGIGPKTAKLIVEHRKTNGINKPADLLEIKGIGPATLKRLAGQLCN